MKVIDAYNINEVNKALGEIYSEPTVLNIFNVKNVTLKGSINNLYVCLYGNSSSINYSNSSSKNYDNSSSKNYDNSSSENYGNSSSVNHDNSSSKNFNNSSSINYSNSSSKNYGNSNSKNYDNSSSINHSNSSSKNFNNSSSKNYSNSSSINFNNSSSINFNNSRSVNYSNSSSINFDNSSSINFNNSSSKNLNNSSSINFNNSRSVNYDNSSSVNHEFSTTYNYSLSSSVKSYDLSTIYLHEKPRNLDVNDNTVNVIDVSKLNIDFNTWLDRGIVCADGIKKELLQTKKLKDITIYKVKEFPRGHSFVAQKGDIFSHGETLKQAVEDLQYKFISADTSKFKNWDINEKRELSELIDSYRSITRACSLGVKDFIQRNNIKGNMSVKEVIEVTEGAYGGGKYKEFFKEV